MTSVRLAVACTPQASLFHERRLSREGRSRARAATIHVVPGATPDGARHGGSFATLEEVIEYYDSGAARNPGLDTTLRPLHLSTREKQHLLAFLHSLAGTIREGR